jgi:hypothetical protein
MEQTCVFGLQYQPTPGDFDLLRLHVKNCRGCRGQVAIL